MQVFREHLPSCRLNISIQVPYNQVQLMRLLSRQVNMAVEHLALSKTTVSWDSFTGPKYRRRVRNIPTEQLRAYSARGQTPAFGTVRHLNIYVDCSIIGGISKAYTTGKLMEMQQLQEFNELLKSFLQNGALRNLQSVRCVASLC